MKNKNVKFFSIGLMFTSIALVSYGQTRQEKTVAIINKLNLIEIQKTNYTFQIESLKDQATGNDSSTIIRLEKKISEEKITERVHAAFDEAFSNEEINDVYLFIQTSAFEKFFNSEDAYNAVSSRFIDIDKEIDSLTNSFNASIGCCAKNETTPHVKKDGFYETIDSSFPSADNDIKLENNPSLTTEDILDAKKTYSRRNNNRPEISITLTKDGAQKFYLLTKKNIGKPIAIVIDNQIVFMPIIQTEVSDGEISIIGSFSDSEIDKMIEKLKGK